MLRNDPTSEQTPIQQLRKQVMALRETLKSQTQIINKDIPSQGDQLYHEYQSLEKLKYQKQGQYKQLMKEHYNFFNNPSWLKTALENHLSEKINRGLLNVNRQIQNLLYSRSSKSSISSSSYGCVETINWIQHENYEKNQKSIKELKAKIESLEQQLQQLNSS